MLINLTLLIVNSLSTSNQVLALLQWSWGNSEERKDGPPLVISPCINTLQQKLKEGDLFKNRLQSKQTRKPSEAAVCEAVEMAFLDNPAIILAHIRQSHVTSDDTGMCEMVLIDQDVDLEKSQPSLVPGSSSSFESSGSSCVIEDNVNVVDSHPCDLSQSMDITSSWDFGIRRRSNTGELFFSLWVF